jgi:hypothetical protein
VRLNYLLFFLYRPLSRFADVNTVYWVLCSSRADPLLPPTIPRSGVVGLLGAPAPLLVAVEEASDGSKRRKITNLRDEAAAVVFRSRLLQLTLVIPLGAATTSFFLLVRSKLVGLVWLN